MGRLSARVNDVQNTAEDAGVAVPIPGREPIPGVTEPRDDARR